MSIRSKVGTILVCVFILYGIVDFAIQRFIILPSFISLEREEAIKDSKRSIQAIQREIHHLDSLCHDWSAWDDTYEFAESPSNDYIEANLVISSFEDNSLNLIYISDKGGKVIWSEIYDLEAQETINLTDFPKDRFMKTHPLVSYKTENKPLSNVTISGVYMTQKGPMLISSRPILNSNNEGPIQGSVIMGRFLNDDIVKMLVDQTQVDFDVFSVQASTLPEAIRDIPNQLTDKSSYLIKTNGDDQLQIYTSFSVINGDTAILIRSKILRKIAVQGTTTVNFAIYSIIIAGIGILIMMLWLLQWSVLKPITKLTNHATSIGKTGDVSVRLSSRRRDEIGILAGEFDNMLEQIEKKSLELEEVNAELQEDISKRKQVENERKKLIAELQTALSEVKTLRGILPLCSFCKKIRDDKGYWEQVDIYIHKHSQADISHSLCPDCAKEHYPDLDIHE